MKYPKFINSKSKISFIAPSLGAAIEPYKTRVVDAKKVLESCAKTYGIKISILPMPTDISVTTFVTTALRRKDVKRAKTIQVTAISR